MVSGDSRHGLDSPVGLEDEEEKLLKQAIALSLEGAAENDDENGEDDEGELMQAIALSLEGAEEKNLT